MSIQTIVLFGNRLYDKTTYSTNQDPQSFSATLSDSMSMTDSEKQLAIKAIAEAITMAEAWITAGNKVLTDSATMTETLAKALIMHTLTDTFSATDTRVIAATKALSEALAVADAIIVASATKSLSDNFTLTEQRLLQAVKVLVDSVTVEDSTISVRQIKGLSEFILLNDWLEMRWKKAEVWQSTPAFGFRPSHIHNYGPGVYYGVDFYSSNPSVNWLLQTANSAAWQMNTLEVPVLPLYAQTLFGQKPYGATPAVGWTKPDNTGRQAWTNENGESHN